MNGIFGNGDRETFKIKPNIKANPSLKMMATTTAHSHQPRSPPLPTVVTLNCIEDPALESSSLNSVATVHHVPLSRIAEGHIESATAVLIHSLAYLPRAAQRRLQPYQLILCLGSSDPAVDSTLAADLGLRLVHVDVSRAEEVADSIMALFLGLLRRTHLLSRQTLSASGWLGAIQPLCRGMRRCRGLMLGIVGRSASARALATRSLAFKMSVLYFDVQDGSGSVARPFPRAARRMDTLNDLLSASDLVSLHCTLTEETVHILNAECLQHVKPGAFLVNTGSSQLLDDCALKQLLIDGTLAGCALDGAEGPQWMEAWIREMPNVLILPRSADYSEEVWMEIREKALSALHSFFLEGVYPNNLLSDEEDAESEIDQDHETERCHVERGTLEDPYVSQRTEDAASSWKKGNDISKESPTLIAESSQTSAVRSEGKRSRSSKKSKRREARQKSLRKPDDPLTVVKETTSFREEDAYMSGTDQALSSSSRFASPDDTRSRKIHVDSIEELVEHRKSALAKSGKDIGPLKDGFVIALHTRDCTSLYASCQRGKGGGWFLDSIANVTKRDPAAQFLVVLRNKDTIGLRSFSSGGKLLQINRRMEFVFASHSFDVWESWNIEGPLEECRLVNCRNPVAILDVRIEVLALLGDEDGIMRWLN